jgi:V/A-type H+-transporting ATPase subunit A
LVRGKEASEQINILGDDGVPVEYHIRYWKSEVFDFVILQQDAFDKVDSSTPIERQKYMMDLVIGIIQDDYDFDNFEEVNQYFRSLINILKQMNYSEYQSDEFKKFETQLKEALKTSKLQQPA